MWITAHFGICPTKFSRNFNTFKNFFSSVLNRHKIILCYLDSHHSSWRFVFHLLHYAMSTLTKHVQFLQCAGIQHILLIIARELCWRRDWWTTWQHNNELTKHLFFTIQASLHWVHKQILSPSRATQDHVAMTISFFIALSQATYPFSRDTVFTLYPY